MRFITAKPHLMMSLRYFTLLYSLHTLMQTDAGGYLIQIFKYA